MNTYETTILLSSTVTGETMGKFDIQVKYSYHPPISATMICPEDPAEVDIVSVCVKAENGKYFCSASLETCLSNEFWQNLMQQIVDTHE